MWCIVLVSMIIYNTVKTLHVQGVQVQFDKAFSIFTSPHTSMLFMLQVKI